MGYFSLNRKNTPRINQTPPPRPPSQYHASNQSPLIVTETTTTRTEVVTTTTQTTTHFLSVPTWRQRSKTNGTNFWRPRTAGSIEVTEELAPSRKRNKELPPTPSGLPLFAPRSPAITSHRHQDASTTSLSQSVPGLGCAQPILPRTPGSSTFHESEVNTIAFVPTLSQSQPVSESFLNVKRPQDSHGSGLSPYLTSPKEVERRTRGISLFGFTSAFDVKVNPKTKEQAQEPASEQLKPLTKKLSFWNRKKSRSRPRPSTVQGDFSDFRDSCEIDLSNLTTPAPSSQKLQSRDLLSHSFSERPHSYYPIASPDVSISPPSLPTRRPTTADNSISTAEHTSFKSSLISGSMRATAPGFLGTNEQNRPLRLRSQTNPPLLRRLSLNVFSSPSLLTASPTSSSSSPLPSSTSDPYRGSMIIPRPLEEESPDIYLGRLMDVVSKAEVTSILASRYFSSHVLRVLGSEIFLVLSLFMPQHWKSSSGASIS